MSAGLGIGVGGCGGVWAYMDKGWQSWASLNGQTDWAEIGDISGDWVWVCAGLWMIVAWCLKEGCPGEIDCIRGGVWDFACRCLKKLSPREHFSGCGFWEIFSGSPGWTTRGVSSCFY